MAHIRLPSVSRRGFLQASALAMASPALLRSEPVYGADERRPILKTLKIGMVNVPGTLTDKFKAVKACGFDGIEMDAPGMNVDETKQAIRESGLPVDGTVCSTHWNVRHSDPDPATRAAALADLKTAITDTHAVGGNSTLLVVGHGKDGTEEEVWQRSIENIAQALPLAAELGIFIAIENVWNQFLYDHSGNHEQTAEKYVKYCDELNSPWVGMHFDIGNHWKYGSMGDWIRQLGRRIVKLDLKGFSRANNKFVPIGEGDLDWADVRKALDEIGFTGWAAAEVSGGNQAALKVVAEQMNRVLELE
ncbi:MAG: sugar phosphate isomerase/epimerase [Planctomycetales bacterium]|nr:sugar phosphate isomerase/epimerase [Planctomycetales bacterium]